MLTSSCQAANWEGKASLFKNKSKLSLFFLQPSNSCHVLISELLQDSETKDTIYKHDCGTQGDSEQNKVLLLPENWRDLMLNIVTPWKFIFFLFFFHTHHHQHLDPISNLFRMFLYDFVANRHRMWSYVTSWSLCSSLGVRHHSWPILPLWKMSLGDLCHLPKATEAGFELSI